MDVKSNSELHKLLKKHPAAKEYEFLFDCCRASFANKTVRYPDNINAGVFYDLLQHHKLITHLYPLLKDCEDIPSELLQIAQKALKQSKLHLLKLSGELARLSKLFEEKKISWLSIKGPALALQLYGDVTARQSGDLDILVNEADLDKASDILVQAGYNFIYDPTNFNPTQIRFWKKHYKDAFLTHPTKNICIELHWRLVINSRVFDQINFFENKNLISIANHKIPTFERNVNVLYLCYHAACHSWRRLFWLWDMTKVFHDADTRQIEELAENMHQAGLDEMLGQTVYLSRLLFGIEIPNRLKNLKISPQITKMALHSIVDQNISNLHQMFRDTIFRKRILTKKNVKPMLAVALINPIHWNTIPLPEKLFFLYYFLRPIAVIIRKINRKNSI